MESTMTHAFDVGLNNKRLTVFTTSQDIQSVSIAPPDTSNDKSRRKNTVMGTFACVSYICVCLSDIFVAPDKHGTKLNIVVMSCTPAGLLYMHRHGSAFTHMLMLAVLHAFACVAFYTETLPGGLRQPYISTITLVALVGIVVYYMVASFRQNAKKNACMLSIGGAMYISSICIITSFQYMLVISQWIIVLMEQTFVLISIIIVSISVLDV